MSETQAEPAPLPSQPTRPPASPIAVKAVDFLLLLILLSLLPFFVAYFSALGYSEAGLGFMYVLVFHVPALVALCLAVLIWGRFRRVPLLDTGLTAVTTAAVGALFMPIFPGQIFVIPVVLASCMVGASAALFFDFGRFAPTTPASPTPSSHPEPGPETDVAGKATARTKPAVFAALGPRARVAAKLLLVGIVITLAQAAFSASQYAQMLERFAKDYGLIGPMQPMRHDWFGLALLGILLILVNRLGLKEALERLGLGKPLAALIPIAILIVPTLPAMYFGMSAAAGQAHGGWPPRGYALFLLALQALFLEGFYRGYLLGGLTGPANWPWAPAVGVSAVLSAALPLAGVISVIDPWWKPILVAMAIELGLSLFSGLLFIANRGNLYPCLAFRLLEPFVLAAVFQGHGAGRSILAAWAAIVLAGSALVARALARSTVGATAAQMGITKK